MSRVSTVTPRERVVSTHWIGSPKSVIGRGRMKYSPVRAKIFAEYVETTGESPITQSPLELFEVRFQLADKQRQLAGRGYGGRVVRVEG